MNAKEMSQRVLGAGIISIGLVVLTIALIMGFEFPKYVFRKNVKELCILNSNHKKYNVWVKDEYRNHINRIYYWTIINEDAFLYHNSTPQVEQRGPYVYRETEEKVDISFEYSTVNFYLMKTQTFDKKLTQEECGSNCQEDDILTIVNPNYLKSVSQFGGDVTYSLYHCADIMAAVLRNITDYHGNGTTFTMQQLGYLFQNDIDQYADLLNYPTGFKNLAFGNWIAVNDTSYKSKVMKHREQAPFGPTEMQGLYSALTNSNVLGSTTTALTNNTFLSDCQSNLTVPNVIYDHLNRNNTYQFLFPKADTPCGLVFVLRKFQEYKDEGNVLKMGEAINVIARYLCINQTFSCFFIPQDLETGTAYISAITDYIFYHLLQFIMHQVVFILGEDIIIRKKQIDLALGYFLNTTSTAQAGPSLNNEYVSGILEHFSRDNIAERGKKISLLNCYDSLDANTNFRWLAYDGELFACKKNFPNASQHERQIFSFRYNLPPIKHLEACNSPSIQYSVLYFFIPEFCRKLVFVKKCPLYVKGIGLDRLHLNKTNLEIDRKYIREQGLQEMDKANGYLSWISLPHFLYGDTKLWTQFAMTPDLESHTTFILLYIKMMIPYFTSHNALLSTVDPHLTFQGVRYNYGYGNYQLDFEPISGIIFGQNLRYQHNVGIKRVNIAIPRYPSLNINYTDRPIPVYWVEKHFLYNSDGFSDHHSRVASIMMASCGGLVGLTIFACLIVIVGVLTATLTIRSGRIAPLEEISLT